MSAEKKKIQITGPTEVKKRRSALRIMGNLIGLVKPLLHVMLAAIIPGTIGYLCAVFLTILAGQAVIHGLLNGKAGMAVLIERQWLAAVSVKTILTVMVISKPSG